MLITKSSLANLKKYTPLIHELVTRDLKKKYRRSVLGYFWSLLNPLLMMLVMTFVFTSIFKNKIPHYPLYLISGQTIYRFFTESTNRAMTAITNSGSLIKKVYVPKFIFPIASVLSSFVIMGLSLVAIYVVKIALRVPFTWCDLLFVIPLFLEFVFCVGMGMILSALSVYFHDIEHLYGVLTTAWMYLTPIFYTLKSLPENVAFVIKLNPLYHYLQFYRLLIMDGFVPEINTWIASVVSAFGMLLVGLIVFRKAQKNFILYI